MNATTIDLCFLLFIEFQWEHTIKTCDGHKNVVNMVIVPRFCISSTEQLSMHVFSGKSTEKLKTRKIPDVLSFNEYTRIIAECFSSHNVADKRVYPISNLSVFSSVYKLSVADYLMSFIRLHVCSSTILNSN